ncbi:MAG: diiron oxygenase [Elusimicrobia bacterium]|nr:diiron oxygenase [Elusimicrobiota bacterium]
MTRDPGVYALPPAPVDLTRFFIPERMTQLFHTPGYAGLSLEKRRRYNQLTGLFLNEMLVFFEDILAETVLGALLAGPLPKAVAEQLAAFRWEEQRHAEMFKALNRKAAPALYRGRDFHFVRVPRAARLLLDAAARRPRLFPLFLWVMILQEDRSLYYSREILKLKDVLDPSFVHVYRVHMADEAGHVRADLDLLERYWAPVPAPWRRVNARMLRWIFGEFFTVPKRAGLRVLETWAAEFPDEAARLPYWRSQLAALPASRDYHASLFSRESVPAAFAGFDRWPELAGMSRELRAYVPGGVR